MDPKYPSVTLRLTGEDGNAMQILSRARIALSEADASKDEVKSFWYEATSGDYDNLLSTTMQWFNVV